MGKLGGVSLKTVIKKKERLEATQKKAYGPLKEVRAQGLNGEKRLKDLRKVGKEFGFHQVLLNTMPAILRKQPDRRQTFDGVAMQQFDTEFAKHFNKLDMATKQSETAIEMQT